MMEMWEKIAYMVQLDLACLLFMLPVRKREWFGARSAGGIVATILLVYGINGLLSEHMKGVWQYVYWASYIFVCVAIVWLCLDVSFMKALYCAICACAMQHVAYDMVLIYQAVNGDGYIVPVLLYAATYLLFYDRFAKKLPENGDFVIRKTSLFPMATIIVLVWILSVMEASGAACFAANVGSRILYRIIDGLCCFYVLWCQVYEKERVELQRELDGIHNAWNRQKKQYEVTRETIDSINRKCHDLKHQIRAVQEMTDGERRDAFFKEIENDIMIYDTAVKTGNKALDVVLMDKGLFCKEHDIQWSCMADASNLEFMRVEDIYAIFGNALDNAIDAVLQLEDTEKRIIGVKIITQNHISVIQVQNYYDAKLEFFGGLPQTRKDRRNHGFGMKSIRHIAEKYNGTITVDSQDGIFMLQILIPN